MNIKSYSNKGSRDENQDYVLYETFPEGRAIFVVADGMGGYSHGAVASRIVAESIIDYVRNNKDNENPGLLMSGAYEYANESLALKRIELDGREMGSVVVSLYLDRNDAYITWLGDSRCYLYRDGREAYCTEDHSILSQLKKIKTLHRYEDDKCAAIVTRCIMGDDQLGKIESVKITTAHNDTFVLCTDGFHKEINMTKALNYDGSKKDELDDLMSNMADNYSFIRVGI